MKEQKNTDKQQGMGESELIIDFYLDSQLVVNQLNGIFKIKDSNIRMLVFRVKGLEQEVGGVIKYHGVPREQNREADLMVNQALDS